MFDEISPGGLALVTFLVVAASPGPANISLAATAMAHGRRAGFAMAAGLSVGLAVWGLVALLGLHAVLASTPALMTALKAFGAAYLLWLAWQSGRVAFRPDVAGPGQAAPGGAGRFAWRGLSLNLLNPKAVLAWTATLSVAVPATGEPVALGPIVAMCAVIGLANYAVHAVVFSFGGVMETYRRLRRWIEAATALVLGSSGIALMLWRSRPQ